MILLNLKGKERKVYNELLKKSTLHNAIHKMKIICKK
jgi:hypothetical protein